MLSSRRLFAGDKVLALTADWNAVAQYIRRLPDNYCLNFATDQKTRRSRLSAPASAASAGTMSSCYNEPSGG